MWERDSNLKKKKKGQLSFSNAAASRNWWSRKDFAKKDRYENKVAKKSG